jgi:hypothetical protein
LPQTVIELAIQWEKYDAHDSVYGLNTFTEVAAIIPSNTCTARGDIFNFYKAENKGEEMNECRTWHRIETVQFETSYNFDGDSSQGMPFFPLF